MKKILSVFALSLVLFSCGSGSSSDQNTDSTAVNVESGVVTANDSTSSVNPQGGSSDSSVPVK